MNLVRISCKMWVWMKLAQKISCKLCGWMELAQDHTQWLTGVYCQGVTTGNDATDSYICIGSSKGCKMLLYCCCILIIQ